MREILEGEGVTVRLKAQCLGFERGPGGVRMNIDCELDAVSKSDVTLPDLEIIDEDEHGQRFMAGFEAEIDKMYEDAEGMGKNHAWDESRGRGVSYGYNRAENIDIYNSSEQLIHELVEIVSRGGNLLLNVGPTADGRIPVIMQERLKDIGGWLELNGEAIYGTRPWTESTKNFSTKNQEQIAFFTEKKDKIFAIYTHWPDNEIILNGMYDPVNEINLYGYEKVVSWKQENGKVFITPPLVSPGTFRGRYAYVFEIK